MSFNCGEVAELIPSFPKVIENGLRAKSNEGRTDQ